MVSMDLYGFFKKFVVKPILRLTYRVEVIGKENLPRVRGTIIAANHLAKADSVIIAAWLKQKVVFGAKKEYFAGKTLAGKLLKWFLHAVDQIPVDRTGRGSLVFIKDAVGIIKERRASIAMHVEGTRSPDGRLYKPRIGVAKIALATHAPVTPLAVIGTDTKRTHWWRIRVQIVIGRPIHYEEYKDLSAAELADLIGRRIHELSDQEYADEHAPIIIRDTLK